MAGNFVQSSEQYLSQIDAEIERLQHLRTQVTGAIEGDKAVSAPKARKGMSAEGRRRVAEAQRARWAKLKKANAADKTKPAKKAARKSSAKKAVAE